MTVLHLDFECFSTLDLKKVGVENYVRAPGFAVTAVGWAFDHEPAQFVVWPNTTLPSRVREHIENGGIVKAWNAAFEWNVLHYGYNLDLPFAQMDCVMQRALAYGLPAALGDAGEALNLNIVKDPAGRRLMLTMGKPKRDGTPWHLDPKARVMLDDLGRYCQRDVEAERALDAVIPPLHKFEKRLSEADARINQKGVLIDLDAVGALTVAAGYQKHKIDSEAQVLSGGKVRSVGNETARVLTWLFDQGCQIPDLTKETVATALAGITGLAVGSPVKRMLELRQEAAKASTAKLDRMTGWASTHDGRARNLLQFYGAGRTGRWAGRGIQVQNLPRPPKGLDTQAVIDVAMSEPHALGLFHESPLDAIKGSLRACLIARQGHVLISVDLSQIEARVLAWLAGQDDVVKEFAAGVDVYVSEAAKVGSTDRQLGKVLKLACGFGMGHVKFMNTAWEQYGVAMTQSEAANYVQAWRQANHRIVAYWRAVAVAVHAAIAHPGLVQQLPQGMMVRVMGGLLEIRKPNSVKLRYHNIRWSADDGLCFDGVDSTTKQWGKQRTYGGKLVENIVQSVARDVMAEGFLRAAPRPIMTVHDEVVWEFPEQTAQAHAVNLKAAMETTPSWAPGLPLGSEIKISRRYGK